MFELLNFAKRYAFSDTRSRQSVVDIQNGIDMCLAEATPLKVKADRHRMHSLSSPDRSVFQTQNGHLLRVLLKLLLESDS